MIESAGPPRYKRGRELAGLSLGQASRMLGIDRTRLTDIEALRIVPEVQEVAAMADAYHTSEAWLDGAAVQVPESVTKILRDSDVSYGDRDTVLEFAGMLSLMLPKPSSAERLAAAAAKHEPDPPIPPRAAKVRYVKSQVQTRSHHCHWAGCTKQVPPAMWGCKPHWFRLPKELRDRIWNAYRPGQESTMTPSTEYLQVADDVQQWIREHGGTP